MIETKLINLNSNYAIQNNSTYLSNVFFSFPSLIVNKNNITKVQVSILNAQFPYSFYIINVYNNLLQLSVDGGVKFILTLTTGNYNSNTLITEILTQLALVSITNISIVLSTITGKLTFTTTGTSIEFWFAGSTIFSILGFNTTTNYVSIAKILVAPYPLNLLNTLKIKICSYALCGNSLDSSVKGSLNLLSSFAVNAESYGLNLYENQTNIKTELQVRHLNGFDIQILDDFGNLINFNNIYWTITMLLEIEYSDEIVSQTINQNYALPKQDYWGANPYPETIFQNEPINYNYQQQPVDYQIQQDYTYQPIPQEPILENLVQDEEQVQEPYIQAEEPNIEINDFNSLEQLLQSKGIY